MISCQRTGIPGKDELPEAAEDFPEDSIAHSSVVIEGGGLVDLFVYEAKGIRKLDLHKRFNCSGDTICHLAGMGEKIAVAIADCPFSFNIDALQMYDSIELLQMNLNNDDTAHPVRSDIYEFRVGEDCILVPLPLMCSIELSMVSNECGWRNRITVPEICLVRANTNAEILRYCGFTANEMKADTLRVSLDREIGSSPQYPGARIHCYPNDGEATIGTPATEFILRGKMAGVTREYKTELPPFGRGAAIKLYLEITAPDEYRYRIF